MGKRFNTWPIGDEELAKEIIGSKVIKIEEGKSDEGYCYFFVFENKKGEALEVCFDDIEVGVWMSKWSESK